MKSLFKEEIKKGSFTIDFSKINKCKGVLFLQIKPVKSNETLVLNSGSDETFTQQNPFVLESHHPMVGGSLLTFKPQNPNAKSVVRMLLVE